MPEALKPFGEVTDPPVITVNSLLINFSSIERLDILHSLFGEIKIPPAVNTELLDKIKIFPKLQLALETPNIQVLKLKLS